MPTTINGIGTSYVGKKNRSAREGVCASCGKQATLSSYDTRLFFVVIFIPIIPLARKRVIDQCSRCSRHRVMPLASFQELQVRTLQELGTAHRDAPGDAAAAVRFNAALFEFDRTEEGLRHLEQLTARFADDVDALFYAGGVYERLGRGAEADRCFERAYQIAPDNPAVRRAQTIQHLRDGDPHAAWSLLRQTPRGERDPSLLLLLGRTYMERSEPRTALEVYRLLLEDHPRLGHDKNVRKAVAAAEKRVSAATSMLPPRSLPWAKIAVGAAVAALAVGIPLALNAYNERHFSVQVVNGYSAAVTLRVDGEPELVVPSAQRRQVEVAEGAHRAEVVAPWQETIDFTVERGFFERFGDGPVAVLNPGGLATLMWEQTMYAEHPDPNYEPVVKLHVGHSFQVFKNVDYRFREFPDEIRLDSKQDRVRKSRLSAVFASPEDVYGWLLANGEAPAALDYLERWLAVAPADDLALDYANAATIAGTRERAARFLRPRLTLAPVNVEWHRAYQQVQETDEGVHQELVREYAAYVDSDPENPELLYLRGRLEPDPDQADVYYGRALAVAADHLPSLRARSYQLMSQGRFAAAAGVLDRVAAVDGDDGDLAQLHREALLASGRLAELDATLRDHLGLGAGEPDLDGPDLDELDWPEAVHFVHVLVRRDRPAQAEAWIRHLDEVEQARPEEERGFLGPWLRCNFFYATKNWTALAQTLREPRIPPPVRDVVALWVAAETGDFDGIEELADGAFDKLVVGLAQARDGRPEVLEARVGEALGNLTQLGPGHRVFRDLWNGDLALTPAQLDRLVSEPRVKAVMLTVLAQRYPEHRRTLQAMAAQLNYGLGFPHYLVASIAGGES